MARHRLTAEAPTPALLRASAHVSGLATTLLEAALVRRSAIRNAAARALSLAAIIPLVLAAAESAAAPRFSTPTPAAAPRDSRVVPVAAVSAAPDSAVVVALREPQHGLRIAEAAVPPPPVELAKSVNTAGIPTIALSAYRNAEQKMAAADPACGINWTVLAGIGRIESMHANEGTTDGRGTALRPIFGPVLDGSLPGNEIIAERGDGKNVNYARAIGPMQFLPGTWAHYASDGDGDGIADPQNLFDSTLAAAKYLCSGGLDLRDPLQLQSAILRYNHSTSYAYNVMGWAAAYGSGVVPVDLPPLTGPPPPLGDSHLDDPHGLGPDLPLNIHALPPTDPSAQIPLIDLGWANKPGQEPGLTGQVRPGPSPNCTLICVGS